ncbi:MAG: AbrB/MazE/SpoVT family DNA-binding domain-containing protein [Rickettsiella sp.]|nr:AbrB/MazE/SpoVT family DNA-binding domain-containing protein [Rickettsiella sp.]
MSRLATARLSSKGQIVIPEEIREQMNLHVGDQFLVLAEDDVVVLKTISYPNKNEFNFLIKKARNAAKKASLTKNDIKIAIKEARRK